jgi:YgiT-type zinc finger domain-containing protein
MEMQSVVEIEIETEEQPAARCGNCGSDRVHEADIRSAFWQGERLVVVEDIPAAVCDNCHEQYFDDRTMVVLDLLRGDGFPTEKARSELRVPVFSFRDRIAPREES